MNCGEGDSGFRVKKKTRQGSTGGRKDPRLWAVLSMMVFFGYLGALSYRDPKRDHHLEKSQKGTII